MRQQQIITELMSDVHLPNTMCHHHQQVMTQLLVASTTKQWSSCEVVELCHIWFSLLIICSICSVLWCALITDTGLCDMAKNDLCCFMGLTFIMYLQAIWHRNFAKRPKTIFSNQTNPRNPEHLTRCRSAFEMQCFRNCTLSSCVLYYSVFKKILKLKTPCGYSPREARDIEIAVHNSCIEKIE